MRTALILLLAVMLLPSANAEETEPLYACMAEGFQQPLPVGDKADASVLVGDQHLAAQLFSYPNNCGPVVCYQDETLPETMIRWFDCSLQRDGFDARTRVREAEGQYYFDIALNADSEQTNLDAFVKRYEEFLQHGAEGIELAQKYHDDGHWLPNWRFILPHGLAMTNNRSLEVMNFPPVSLVLKTQDYLNSATTRRWNKMLHANGAAKRHYALYGAILDIVPVAAPANEGWKLNKNQIYDGAFNGYAEPMLDMWTRVVGEPDQSKPVMTLGHEMLVWFNTNYKTSFAHALDLQMITLKGGRQVPVMYTHHPSAIFYSDSYDRASYFMDDDAIASCWQANLGKDPGAGAQTVKENCTTVWEGRKTLKCEMIFEQVCALNAEASAQMCARDNLSSLKNEDGHKWCPLKDKDGNLIDKLAAGEAAVEEPTTAITQ